MIDLTCPLCGSVVRVPKAEARARYDCKKCHTPFHLNQTGKTVVGSPAPVPIDAEVDELKRKVRQEIQRVPWKLIAGGVAALLFVGAVLYAFLGPPERLDRAADNAAQAFSRNDLDSLKAIAVPGTADDVARWYEEFHPRLDQARERWKGKGEVVKVQVAREDRTRGKGMVGVSFQPASGNARDVSLANPTEATASADAPVEMQMAWTLTSWGRWQLDGRETYANAHPGR